MRCRVRVGAVLLLAVLAAGLMAQPWPAAGRAVTPFREHFERGALGTKPTSANTAYDQTIGDRGDGDGSIHVVFARYGFRGHAARFYNGPVRPGAFGFLGERVGRQRLIFFRRYYRLSARPAYRTSVLLYKYGGSGDGQLGGTHNGSFAFGGSNQSNRFTLVNDNTNATRSTARVPIQSWFRVEVRLDFRTVPGRQTVRLFLGRNVNGTRPTETVSAPLTGPYTDYVEDGILTNPDVPVRIRVDEVANGSTWAGPVA